MSQPSEGISITCKTAVLLLASAALSSSARADGNVTVTSSASGDISVVGDQLANRITIESTGTQFVIRGEDTTVNGSSEPVTVAGAGKLTVTLAEGNDRVLVSGNLPNDVVLNGNDGDDALLLERSAVRGHVLVEGGPGSDQVDIQGTAIGRTLVIRTAEGSDLISVFGSDLFGDVRIESGPEDDSVVTSSTRFRRSLTVLTDIGNDQLVFEDIRVLGNLLWTTGDGSDAVRFATVKIASSLKGSLGSGDDKLAVGNTAVGGQALFDGGPGFDVVADEGGNSFAPGQPRVSSFEGFQ